MKTLLVAAGLLVGQSVWAGDVTTLYERGTTTSWSDADLTDWTVTTGSVDLSLIDGVLGFTETNTSPGPSYTKAITPTSNAIVTLNASLTAASAAGNSSSYDYITKVSHL